MNNIALFRFVYLANLYCAL